MMMLLLSASFAGDYLENPDIWKGMSVATSDNLDALTINPAGLGILRGSQSGFHILSPKDENLDPTYYLASRSDGFGFTLYGSDDLYYNLAIGSSLGDGLNFGYRWDSHKVHTLGFMYRPESFASFGVMGSYYANPDVLNTRVGFAVRPLGHRFTVGADVVSSDWQAIEDYDTFKRRSDLSAFIEVQPVDGVFLSVISSEDGDDLSLNLGFDFGEAGVYGGFRDLSGSEATQYGFYSHSELMETILKKKNKKDLNYVRMELSNVMIEEPEYRTPFNFNFDINPFSSSFNGTQLRTWIDKMDELTADDNIDGLIIDYKFVGGGFGKISEVRDALMRFKDSGKKIIVYGQSLNNFSSYVISMADEVYIAPLGEVDLRGLNLELNFYKGMMDKLDVVGEFEQISPYKTAPDPFLREDMSDAMRENYSEVFDDLYDQFVQGIASGHQWTLQQTKMIIDNGPYMPADAIKAGLITGTMFPEEFEKYIEEFDDQKVRITKWHDFNSMDEYVHDWREEELPTIAIVYAVGGISSGKSKPGTGGSSVMGDETIREAVRAARENKDVDAIVFRIDSGGGSALASDNMWYEIYKTTDPEDENHKPFIASMSDVAASGGYYIACQADKIVAYPNTITGSIGVVSGRINFSGLLEKVGISSDRIKYGKHSDFYSNNKLWSDEEKAIVRKGIEDVYNTFKQKVADGRDGLEFDDLDPIALGRIWSGNQAKENGLIDEVGGLDEAITIAKQAAGIAIDQEVNIVEYPKFHSRFSIFGGLTTELNMNMYLPEEILEQLEMLDIIPVFEDDDIQLIMPFTVKID